MGAAENYQVKKRQKSFITFQDGVKTLIEMEITTVAVTVASE